MDAHLSRRLATDVLVEMSREVAADVMSDGIISATAAARPNNNKVGDKHGSYGRTTLDEVYSFTDEFAMQQSARPDCDADFYAGETRITTEEVEVPMKLQPPFDGTDFNSFRNRFYDVVDSNTWNSNHIKNVLRASCTPPIQYLLDRINRNEWNWQQQLLLIKHAEQNAMAVQYAYRIVQHVRESPAQLFDRISEAASRLSDEYGLRDELTEGAYHSALRHTHVEDGNTRFYDDTARAVDSSCPLTGKHNEKSVSRVCIMRTEPLPSPPVSPEYSDVSSSWEDKTGMLLANVDNQLVDLTDRVSDLRKTVQEEREARKQHWQKVHASTKSPRYKRKLKRQNRMSPTPDSE